MIVITNLQTEARLKYILNLNMRDSSFPVQNVKKSFPKWGNLMSLLKGGDFMTWKKINTWIILHLVSDKV